MIKAIRIFLHTLFLLMLILFSWLAGPFPHSAWAESCAEMAVRAKQECWGENQRIERLLRDLSALARTYAGGSAQETRARTVGEELIRVQYDFDKLRQGYELMLSSSGYCHGKRSIAQSMHQDLLDRLQKAEEEVGRLQEEAGQ